MKKKKKKRNRNTLPHLFKHHLIIIKNKLLQHLFKHHLIIIKNKLVFYAQSTSAVISGR